MAVRDLSDEGANIGQPDPDPQVAIPTRQSINVVRRAGVQGTQDLSGLDRLNQAVGQLGKAPPKEHWYSGVVNAAAKGGAEFGSQALGAGEYLANRVYGSDSTPATLLHSARTTADDAASYWQNEMTPEQQADINSQWSTLDPTKSIWTGGPGHFFHALTLQTAAALPSTMMTLLPATAWAKVGATGKALAYIGATQAGLSMGSIANNISNEIAQTPEDKLRAQSPRYNQILATGASPEEARRQLTDDAQRYAPVLGGTVTGAISVLAGRFLSPVLSKEGASLGARIGGGAADQAIQGAGSAGADYLASEAAASTYDKTRSPTIEGFANQALEGGVTGAVQGAAFGAAAGHGPEPHGANPQQDAFGEQDVHKTMAQTPEGKASGAAPEAHTGGPGTPDEYQPVERNREGFETLDAQGPQYTDAELQKADNETRYALTGNPQNELPGMGQAPPGVAEDIAAALKARTSDVGHWGVPPRDGYQGGAAPPADMQVDLQGRNGMQEPNGPQGNLDLRGGQMNPPRPGPTPPVAQAAQLNLPFEQRVKGAGRQLQQPMTSARTEYSREDNPQTVADALRQRNAQRADVNQPDLFRDNPPPGQIVAPNNRPMVRGTTDSPSPEPYGDLAAQMRDLTDPQHPRAGVYLSADNLESLRRRGMLDHLRELGGSESVPLLNFDRKGGVLIAKDDATAQDALKMRDQFGKNPEGMQEVLGLATGAGEGKPVSQGQLVVQQKDDQGNVTRETLARDQEHAEQLQREYTDVAGGRTASISTAPAAVLRRAEIVGREQEIANRAKAESDTGRDVRGALRRNVGDDLPVEERAQAAAGRDLVTGQPSPPISRGEAATRLTREARNIHNEERALPGANTVPDPRALKFASPDAAQRYETLHNEWIGAQVMEGTPNTKHPEYTEKGEKGREILERRIARFLATHNHEFRARGVGRAALELQPEAVREFLGHEARPESEGREATTLGRLESSQDSDRPDVALEQEEEAQAPRITPHPTYDVSQLPRPERRSMAEVHALMKNDPTAFEELYNEVVNHAAQTPRSKLTREGMLTADDGKPSLMEKRVNRYFRSREAAESLSGAKSKPMLVSKSRPLTDEEINQNRNRKETGKPKVTGFESLKPESLIATVPSQREMDRRASSPMEAVKAAKERLTQIMGDVKTGEKHLKELTKLKASDMPKEVKLYRAQKYMRDLLQYGRVLRDQGLQSPKAIRAAKQFSGLIKKLGKMEPLERARYLGDVFDAEFRNQNLAATLVSPDSLTHFKDLPEVVAKANKTLEQNRVAREEFRKALAESPTAEDAFIKKMDAEIERDRLRDLADERNLAMGTTGARAPERRPVEPTGLHDSVISAMMAADPRITEGKSVSLSELHNEAHGQMGDKQIHDEIAHLIAEGLLVPKKTNVGRPLTPREKYLQYEDAQGNKFNKVMLHPGLVERLQNRFVERGISNEDTYIPERAARAVTPEDLVDRPTSRGVFPSPGRIYNVSPQVSKTLDLTIPGHRVQYDVARKKWNAAHADPDDHLPLLKSEGFLSSKTGYPGFGHVRAILDAMPDFDSMHVDEGGSSPSLAIRDGRNVKLDGADKGYYHGSPNEELKSLKGLTFVTRNKSDAQRYAEGQVFGTGKPRKIEELNPDDEQLRSALGYPQKPTAIDNAARAAARHLEDKPKSASQILPDIIRELDPGSPMHKLFSALQRVADPETLIGYAGKEKFSAPTTLGHTEWAAGGPIIRINRDLLENIRAGGRNPTFDLMHTLGHELAHVATTRAIEGNPAVRERLQAILAEVRRQPGAERFYGATTNSVNEMVAEAYSNPRFQKFLDSVQIRGVNRSLWARFKQVVADVLGWNSTKENFTALDAIMREHGTIFRGKQYATTKGELTRMRFENLEQDKEGSHVGNALDRIMKSASIDKETVRNLAERAGDLSDKAGQFQLSAMTPRQQRAQYGRFFKQVDGSNPYERYWDTYFDRAADNARSMERVGKLSNKWSDLEEKFGADAANSVSKLMHDASIYSFSPDKPITASANEHLSSAEQKARHAAGKAVFDSLPPEWQKHYQEVREYYRSERQNSADQMVLNGLHAMLTKGDEAAMTPKQFDAKYDASSIRQLGLDRSEGLLKEFGDNLDEASRGVLEKIAAIGNKAGDYFPLTRDGEYIVTAKRDVETKQFDNGKEAAAYATEKRGTDPTLSVAVKKMGDAYHVVTTEKEVRTGMSKSEAMRHRREMAAAYGEENTTPVQLKSDYYKGSSDITTGSALDTLMRKLEGNEAAQNAIKEFYLQSLGDQSVRKRELHRKNVRGVDVFNQHRAFAQYGRSQSYYLSQLKYGRHLANAQAEVNKAVLAHRDESEVSATRMGQFAKELTLRDEISRNPYQVSDLVRRGTSLTQFMMITSPSHWFVRAAQPYVLSAPWLGARHGLSEATGALARAQRMIADPLVTETAQSALGLKALFSRHAAEKSYSVIDQVLGHINRTAGADAPKITALVQRLRDNNLIDLSMATELSDIAKGKSTGLTGRVLDASRIMLHLIEVNNRVMTGIAARELAIKKGATEEEAYLHAADAINVTHNDYSYGNTPRLFMAQAKGLLGGARPLMFQFMKYPQQIYGMLISSTLQALKGKTREEQAMGVKTLAGILGTHLLAAGAVGATLQPIKWAVGALMAGASAAGMTDEPYTIANALSGDSADNLIRSAMNDLFGSEMGELVSKGLPAAVGVDLSQRMALGTTYQFHLKTDSDASTIGSIAQTFGGPWLNIATNFYDAGRNFLAGKPVDAVQELSPHIIRDLVKAGAMSQRGIVDNAGRATIPAENLSFGQIFAQSLGFRPEAVAEAQDRKNWETGTEANIIDQRKSLLQRFVGADPDQRAPVNDAIAEFNKAHPGFAIDGSARFKALAQKQQAERELQQYGVRARAKQLPELSRAGAAYNAGS